MDTISIAFGIGTMFLGSILGVVGGYVFNRRMNEKEKAEEKNKRDIQSLVESTELTDRLDALIRLVVRVNLATVMAGIVALFISVFSFLYTGAVSVSSTFAEWGGYAYAVLGIILCFLVFGYYSRALNILRIYEETHDRMLSKSKPDENA